MREYITPNFIANQIRLLRDRSQYTGYSFLIAEGDTDARVWKNLVDSKKCRVENAHNKDNAVKVLNILEQSNFAGILAVVDADFDCSTQSKLVFHRYSRSGNYATEVAST
jgi:hypothetical protein